MIKPCGPCCLRFGMFECCDVTFDTLPYVKLQVKWKDYLNEAVFTVTPGPIVEETEMFFR